MITKMKTIAATTALAGALMLGAQSASAATCPDYVNAERVFTLTPEDALNTASCYAYGTGNINGTSTSDPILTGSDTTSPDSTITFASGMSNIDGLVLLDKSDTSGNLLNGAISNWVVDAVTGTLGVSVMNSAYDNLILAIKSGNNLNPSWAAFNISASGDYTFKIDPKGGNSHTNLYGVPSVVPLPAAGWLLLMGIGGLGVASRRRRKAQHS